MTVDVVVFFTLQFSFCPLHHIQISIKKLFLIHFATLYVYTVFFFFVRLYAFYRKRARVCAWSYSFWILHGFVLFNIVAIFARYCVQNALCFCI